MGFFGKLIDAIRGGNKEELVSACSSYLSLRHKRRKGLAHPRER